MMYVAVNDAIPLTISALWKDGLPCYFTNAPTNPSGDFNKRYLVCLVSLFSCCMCALHPFQTCG